MRCGRTIAALLLAALVAAFPLHAQQQEAPPGPSLEQVIEGIGDAVRGIFRSIFRADEGAKPVPPEPMPQETAPQKPAPEAAKSEAPKAPAPAVADTPSVTHPITPSAQATQTLHAAIAKGDYASAIRTIEQGADIEAKDPGAGASALHYAVMRGSLPMIGLLLQRGADLNSRTRSGTTPLHTAILYGHHEVVEYLLDRGADINAKSVSGVTPLNLAETAGLSRITRILRARGAN